jgi:hypothetical protein
LQPNEQLEFKGNYMLNNQSQTKILAQAIYEIRQLLSGYLGSSNKGDIAVREGAYLSYALHNEALAIIENKSFDSNQAIAKINAVDKMFDKDFAP